MTKKKLKVLKQAIKDEKMINQDLKIKLQTALT
jgi:hypothetical protein